MNHNAKQNAKFTRDTFVAELAIGHAIKNDNHAVIGVDDRLKMSESERFLYQVVYEAQRNLIER